MKAKKKFLWITVVILGVFHLVAIVAFMANRQQQHKNVDSLSRFMTFFNAHYDYSLAYQTKHTQPNSFDNVVTVYRYDHQSPNANNIIIDHDKIQDNDTISDHNVFSGEKDSDIIDDVFSGEKDNDIIDDDNNSDVTSIRLSIPSTSLNTSNNVIKQTIPTPLNPPTLIASNIIRPSRVEYSQFTDILPFSSTSTHKSLPSPYSKNGIHETFHTKVGTTDYRSARSTTVHPTYLRTLHKDSAKTTNTTKSGEYRAHDSMEKQVYNPGFPGRKTPDDLIGWRPSSHTHAYFRPIDDEEAWLYSAFFDEEVDDSTAVGSVIRAFGIVRASLPRQVYCHFWDSRKYEMGVMQAGRIVPIRDKSFFEYLATSVVCPISSKDIRPHYVSVTFSPRSTNQTQPTNPLPVQYPGHRTIRNFTVCYSPLHSKYNTTFQLIQSVEFNRILGAEYFVFYNFSISSSTDEILQYYKNKEFATILQWPLPVMGSWYYGQLAAINDCIYRNKMTSRFVVLIDTDEFIIPNSHSHWWDLINDVISFSALRDNDVKSKNSVLISTPPPKHTINVHQNDTSLFSADEEMTEKKKRKWPNLIGGISFRNVVHSLCVDPNENTDIEQLKSNFTGKELPLVIQYPSSVLVQVRRSNDYDEHEKRSKLIIRPEVVHHGSIHKMISYKGNYGVVYAKKDTGAVHHYHSVHNKRLCTASDYTVFRYKAKLMNRLSTVMLRFPNIFPIL